MSIARRCLRAGLLAAILSFAVIVSAANGTGAFTEHSAAYPVTVPKEAAAEATETSTETPGEAGAPAGSLPRFAVDSSVITVSIKGEPVQMELEDYLVGVVAGEMPVSAMPAALQAQAVAARTFTALHMAGGSKCSHGAPGCTVCDDPYCCQAYKSPEELMAAWGGEYGNNIEKIRSAVRATESMIVMYGGRPISALYHASSGAATESSEAVFAMALPYLVSVDSCEGDTAKVTVHEFSAGELVEKVNEAVPEAKLSLPLKENDIDVWGRTESGRVQLIRLGETVVSGQTLRMLLGLKSTAFTVEMNGDSVTFTCTGYGHGVGMSQYGAMEMASEGSSFGEILLHYYTGTELGVLTYGG